MLAWGANSCGQLGTGDSIDRCEPTLISSDNNVDIVTGGGSHSMIVKGYQIYTCGSHSAGQLGRGGCDRYFLPSGTPFDCGIRTVTCGWDFSFILTTNGMLYGVGSNSHNQLCGDMFESASRMMPIPVPPLISISAGLRHVVAITKFGSVLSWGSNRRGQLGMSASSSDRSTNRCTLSRVDLSGSLDEDEIPVDCAAGAYHSAVLTDKGSVILIGELKYLQSPETVIQSSLGQHHIRFTPSSFNGRAVVRIASGWSHMITLTDDGTVFTWGRSDLDQLGRSSVIDIGSRWSPPFDPIPSPVLFADSEHERNTRIVSIAAGSEHCLAVDSHGCLWAWGWNEHGMCGVVNRGSQSASESEDRNTSIKLPQVVCLPSYRSFQGTDVVRIKSVGAGYGHSLAVVI